MRSIKPYIIVDLDIKHKNTIVLPGGAELVSLLHYRSNNREKFQQRGEVKAIYEGCPENIKIGDVIWFHHNMGQQKPFDISGWGDNHRRIPIMEIFFVEQGETMLPLCKNVIGRPYFKEAQKSQFFMTGGKPYEMKDYAIIEYIDPNIEDCEIEVGDLVRTCKYGAGYKFELNGVEHIKMKYDDILLVITKIYYQQ